MLNVKNLKKYFKTKNETIKVLDSITLDIKKGEIIGILGSSGCGKSTFLKCLNGLEIPTSGKIFFKRQDINDPKCNINKIREHIGMVFQNFNLFNNFTVLQNLIFAPLRLKKLSREDAKEKAMSILKKVGLTEKTNTYPFSLSGGQKQRIAIARSLMMQPDVMLFDEPTSALDPENISKILGIVREISKESMTIVLVTHELHFIKNIASRIIFFSNGHVLQDACPDEIFRNPKHEKVKKFLQAHDYRNLF
ncbi:MAG: amino acid ABC transporter ATP-binding protein [Oscillospiraceae bacterium]|jgi:polar amino acid transport system ATP-binding protein|nr:amino acid ABC transporter ATP-binding protein [Oscillospiraceae bacterium]